MQVLIRLHSKQLEAFKILTDNITQEVVFGGAKNGGKSYLGVTFIFGSALMYPGTNWFVARNELNDLRKYTMSTVFEVFKNWKLNTDHYFNFNGQDNVFNLTNGSKVFFIAAKYLPQDPLFERFGSMQMTGGWIEEAGEIAFMSYENLKLSIGRWMNDTYGLLGKLLITCNPKKGWLYNEFYKPFKEGVLSPIKAFIQSLVTDNSFRQDGSLERLDNIKDAVAKQRLRYGNWEYDDDPSALIDYDAIMDLFTNDHVEGGIKYITADIARYGSDNTVIYVWDGWRLIDIKIVQQSSIQNTGNILKQYMNSYRIPASQVLVDEDGVGGGVVDMLRCKGFVNNSSPIQHNGEKQNYSNLKSQCYYILAGIINDHNIYIQTSNEEYKELLKQDLEQVKQKSVDSDGKLGVLSKDKVKEIIGRSPDYSDPLMMRVYFDLIKLPINKISSYKLGKR